MTKPQGGHTTPLPSSARLFGVLLCLHCTGALFGNRASLTTAEHIIARHSDKLWAETEASPDRHFHFIPTGDLHHG